MAVPSTCLRSRHRPAAVRVRDGGCGGDRPGTRRSTSRARTPDGGPARADRRRNGSSRRSWPISNDSTPVMPSTTRVRSPPTSRSSPRPTPPSFGICVATIGGAVYEVGDTRQPFTLQSISKPLTYGLALADHGEAAVRARIGVEPTGDAFNAIALSPGSGIPFNPMVNAGAIAAAGLVGAVGRPDGLRAHRRHVLGVGRPPARRRRVGLPLRTRHRATATGRSPTSCGARAPSTATRTRPSTATSGSAPSPSTPATWRSWAPRSPPAGGIR